MQNQLPVDQAPAQVFQTPPVLNHIAHLRQRCPERHCIVELQASGAPPGFSGPELVQAALLIGVLRYTGAYVI